MKSKSTVLIVDDDPSFRMLVRNILESKDEFEVLEAGDVTDGLAVAAKDLPQVIILDLMMPKRSGQDFLVEARTNTAIRHIPILVCSGRDSELDERRCRILGATSFIRKPFDLDSFRLTVGRAVGR